MIYIILFCGLIFCLIYLGLCIHIFRGLNITYTTSNNKPFITILIPARDEEEVISDCLRSIIQLKYPVSKTEVIILDDRSTDRTTEIVKEFCREYSHLSLKTIEEDKHGLSGKMNVLNQGIDIASGEIILITDADCEVTPEWADGLVSYFTEDTGMVGGITLLSKMGKSESWFSRIQALDWLFLQAIASGIAGKGIPVSILGNNFAFRKEAYEQTGGYATLGFSLTEDMVLMNAISKLKNWQIKYPLQSHTMLFSQAAQNISELFHQRRRWVSGGVLGPKQGWFLMLTAFMTHLYILCSLLFLPWHVLTTTALVLILMADYIFIVYPLAKRLQILHLLKYFLLFEVYYFLYTTILAFLILIPVKISWKGRKY